MDHEKRGHKKAEGFRNVDMEKYGERQLDRTYNNWGSVENDWRRKKRKKPDAHQRKNGRNAINRKRKLQISTAPTKVKLWEPTYSQALPANSQMLNHNRIGAGVKINVSFKMILCIFHTCNSKHILVLVKCCTREILCAHRLYKIRGNIGQDPESQAGRPSQTAMVDGVSS